MIKDLLYKPLGNGIMNARIPINDVVQVSLSYSLYNSSYSSIGTKEEPQGAIILAHSNIEDLYTLNNEGYNTKQCNNSEDIDYLIKLAENIAPNLLLSIYDTCDANPPKWHPRFITEQDSFDYLYKLTYLNRTYSKDKILITEI